MGPTVCGSSHAGPLLNMFRSHCVFDHCCLFRTFVSSIRHQQVGHQHHGSLPRRFQTLPADANTYDLYATHQEPQKQQPSQPPDVSTLQKASSPSRQALLAAMLLKVRTGDHSSSNGSEWSSDPVSPMSPALTLLSALAH